MKKNSFFIVLDWVLAAIFLVGIIYMYELRVSPTDSSVQSAQNPAQLSAQPAVEPLTLLFARTDAERQLGLGQRASLLADEGMLFIFDTPGEYDFWMKDMSFSIDMIWLDADFRIVHIESDVSPSTYPQAFSPGAPSLYVLETNAGYAKENNLSAGEKLDFVQAQMEAARN